MSKRSTDHATFVIERTYDAPRERVKDDVDRRPLLGALLNHSLKC